MPPEQTMFSRNFGVGGQLFTPNNSIRKQNNLNYDNRTTD